MFRPPKSARAGRPLAALAAILGLTLAGPSAPSAATGAASAAPAAQASSPSAAPSADAAVKTAPHADAKSAVKARFKGVVQDDKLQPLAGATVTVAVIPKSDEPRGGGGVNIGGGGGGGRMVMRRGFGGMRRAERDTKFFEAKTDAGGAFLIDAEGQGTYNLRVDAPGFAPTIVEKVQPGESVNTLFLRKGVSASGLVADLASSSPVPDAEVLVFPDDAKGFRDPDDPKRFAVAVRTGREGTFTASNLST